MQILWEHIKQVFKIENSGSFKISREVIDILLSFVQDDNQKLEAGGVIVGRFLKNSKDIVVDKASIPMHGDIRKRNYFKRSTKKHQEFIDKEWNDSKGTCNYLGEWHTHADDYPVPSGLDQSEWKRKLKEDVFSSRYLYFIIVGIKEIRVWEGDRRTLKIKQIYFND